MEEMREPKIKLDLKKGWGSPMAQGHLIIKGEWKCPGSNFYMPCTLAGGGYKIL
jgi:hypothetical protein